MIGFSATNTSPFLCPTRAKEVSLKMVNSSISRFLSYLVLGSFRNESDQFRGAVERRKRFLFLRYGDDNRSCW